MIKGQAEAFYRHFKHRYREVPFFKDVYNDTIEVVKESGVPFTLKNIETILSDFVEKRDVLGVVQVHNRMSLLFIVEKDDGVEEMLSFSQIIEDMPYLCSTLELIDNISITVKGVTMKIRPYTEEEGSRETKNAN